MSDAFLLPRYVPSRSLRELALHHFNLKLTCLRCSHIRVFEGHCIWWLFEQRRWNDDIERIGRRFWCSRCFMANPRKVHCPRLEKSKDEPTGDPLPWPDEREWKRVVSRYRC